MAKPWVLDTGPLGRLTHPASNLELESTLVYLPLTTAVMRHAADLWAEARRRGRPTAGAQALDGDVILAAQTLAVGGRVATENVGHLSQFVEAFNWRSA